MIKLFKSISFIMLEHGIVYISVIFACFEDYKYEKQFNEGV